MSTGGHHQAKSLTRRHRRIADFRLRLGELQSSSDMRSFRCQFREMRGYIPQARSIFRLMGHARLFTHRRSRREEQKAVNLG
eukprot:29037-Pelagococcus_subviridis.AAC.3